QADAVGMQRVEGVFDLLEGGVGVEHRQRREQAEAAGKVLHHAGAVVAAQAHHAGRLVRARIEPQAGGGGERQDPRADAGLVHLLDRLLARPADLAWEMRPLARVFPVEPRLLVLGRIEVVMGVDQARLVLPACRATQRGNGAECPEPGDEAAPGEADAARAADRFVVSRRHLVLPFGWRFPTRILAWTAARCRASALATLVVAKEPPNVHPSPHP